MIEAFGLRAIISALSTHLLTVLNATRAAKIDNLDAAVATRAPASTALSTSVWTSDLATALASGNARAPALIVGETTPTVIALALQVPQAYSRSVTITTADVLETALSVTGAGTLKAAAISTGNAVSTTLRMKITIDGNVVSDQTSAAIATASNGFVAIGTYTALGFIVDRIPFNTSLLVEVTRSSGASPRVHTLHEES